MLVNRNAQYQNHPVINKARMFYRQLLHILVLNVKPAVLPKNTSTTVFLRVIRTCVMDSNHNVLDIHYYKNHGHIDVVKITTIQCVVGRIKDHGCFAIIDQSGALAHPEFVG